MAKSLSKVLREYDKQLQKNIKNMYLIVAEEDGVPDIIGWRTNERASILEATEFAKGCADCHTTNQRVHVLTLAATFRGIIRENAQQKKTRVTRYKELMAKTVWPTYI